MAATSRPAAALPSWMLQATTTAFFAINTTLKNIPSVRLWAARRSAVNLDKNNGKEINRNSLKTAGKETILTVLPEKTEVKAGEVCFVRLRFTDKNGAVKPIEHREISVELEDGELLVLGNAARSTHGAILALRRYLLRRGNGGREGGRKRFQTQGNGRQTLWRGCRYR